MRTSYVLPGDAVFPEGIAAIRSTGEFFVGSARDGSIFAGEVGEPSARLLLAGGKDGRASALGLEVDSSGRLYVAGGATGLAFVYDIDQARLLHRCRAPDASATGTAFGSLPLLNDVAIARGQVFLTDSFRPVIYRLPSPPSAWTEDLILEPWIDLAGTSIRYRTESGAGAINLNGMVASADGHHLLTIQMNTGKLFRIGVETRTVEEVDLAERWVPGGDGLLLIESTLYVIRDGAEPITQIKLADDLLSGEATRFCGNHESLELKSPTSAALAAGRILIVNSQLPAFFAGESPELPFTVTSIPVP